jgi:predicted DNA repair protein MutK
VTRWVPVRRNASAGAAAGRSPARLTPILTLVALGITVLVYGVVGLIVMMDDVELRLAELPRMGVARLGRGLVKAMPRLLTALTVVGTAAMLWVAVTSCWWAQTSWWAHRAGY